MGADIEPDVIVHAVYSLPAEIFEDTSFVLYATADEAKRQELQYKEDLHLVPISFRPCKEMIAMDDAPMHAIKKKKESTLAVGLKEHKEGLIDAFVSCANTGALVAQAVLTLPKLEPILRPALVTTLPSIHAPMVVLDVGATVSASYQQLVQFALLGACFSHTVIKNKNPRVALLNIGAEYGKGTQELHDAYDALKKMAPSCSFTFVGNKEPQALFTEQVDVVVTNGFTGNIFLKTSEAIARLVLEVIERNFKGGNHPDALFPFSELKRSFSQDEGIGAFLYGLDGYVLKCHGSATIASIQKGLLGARSLLEKELITVTKAYITSLSTQPFHILIQE